MKKEQDKEQQVSSLFIRYKTQLEDSAYVSVDFLVLLVDMIRPKHTNLLYQIDIQFLLDYLNAAPEELECFQLYLKRILASKDFDQLISDTGIISYADFFYELKKRITERYLPFQPPKSTLQYILNQVFYKPRDADWIATVSQEQVDELFRLCRFETIYDDETGFGMIEILYGLELLVQRITGRAMETDVNKMVPEFQNFDSPFIAIMREFTELNDRILQSDNKFISSDDLSYKQILVLHKQCESYIETAFDNSHRFGISIKVNQSLLRMRQQLERIREILLFLVIDNPEEKKEKTIALAMTLIGYNSRKSNIRKLVGQSTQLLAYEITHHTAQTGEHYITSSRQEYWKMFRSACGGGLIVGVMCI
ncbi:MAG: hypothetical protein ACN6OW_07020, partial [Sphingobacterium paramultivorum]